MRMIGLGVSRLGDLNALMEALQPLAARHRGYGVKNSGYGTVATALHQTLDLGLGSAFTAEVRATWTTM